MNPCNWRVIDAATRKAECVHHHTLLERYEGTSKKGKRYVLYTCRVADFERNLPGYKPAPGSPFNERGYCKTSGFVSEIFEEDVK